MNGDKYPSFEFTGFRKKGFLVENITRCKMSPSSIGGGRQALTGGEHISHLVRRKASALG